MGKISEKYEIVRKILRQGQTVVLTGAGVSQESGIPTFRGRGGLWEKYPAEEFATPRGLQKILRHDPERILGFVKELYYLLVSAQPNVAHRVLAEMEQLRLVQGVITQNVDDLHARAGSRRIFELHGNAFRLRCEGCSRRELIPRKQLEAYLNGVSHSSSRHIYSDLIKIFFKKCLCGHRMRIDIVLFTELLPQDTWNKSLEAIRDAQTVLLVGTSGIVQPAAELPLYAKHLGKTVIEVNTHRTEVSDIADYVLTGRAGEVMGDVMSVSAILKRDGNIE